MASSLSEPWSQQQRLFELLEEQQEPFMLDVFLMERDYSTRILECEATTVCWPGIGCMGMQRFSSRSTMKKKKGWLRKFMLAKLLLEKVLHKARNWEARNAEHRMFSACDPPSEVAGRMPDDKPGQTQSSGCIAVEEANVEHQWNSMEMGNPKQLSPVSVLQFCSDEESSPLCDKEVEELGSPREASDMVEELLHKNELILLLEQKGVASEMHITCPGFLESTDEWTQYLHHLKEIGIAIESLIFEEIREESVLGIIDYRSTWGKC